jgi:hypothetical protein
MAMMRESPGAIRTKSGFSSSPGEVSASVKAACVFFRAMAMNRE